MPVAGLRPLASARMRSARPRRFLGRRFPARGSLEVRPPFFEAAVRFEGALFAAADRACRESDLREARRSALALQGAVGRTRAPGGRMTTRRRSPTSRTVTLGLSPGLFGRPARFGRRHMPTPARLALDRPIADHLLLAIARRAPCPHERDGSPLARTPPLESTTTCPRLCRDEHGVVWLSRASVVSLPR